MLAARLKSSFDQYFEAPLEVWKAEKYRLPSPLETIALENSEMLRISRDNIDQLKATPIGGMIFLISAAPCFLLGHHHPEFKQNQKKDRETVISYPKATFIQWPGSDLCHVFN